MAHKTTPAELVANTVWSIEHCAHKVKISETEKDARKYLRALREKVDELEYRAMNALAATRAPAAESEED